MYISQDRRQSGGDGSEAAGSKPLIALEAVGILKNKKKKLLEDLEQLGDTLYDAEE